MDDLGDISPVRRKELINKIAEQVVTHDMEDYALAFIEGSRPVSWVGSQLLTVFVYPFSPIFGERSDDIVTLFYDRKNIDRLIDRIKELSTEKREKKKNTETSKTGWKTKLKKFFWS